LVGDSVDSVDSFVAGSGDGGAADGGRDFLREAFLFFCFAGMGVTSSLSEARVLSSLFAFSEAVGKSQTPAQPCCH